MCRLMAVSLPVLRMRWMSPGGAKPLTSPGWLSRTPTGLSDSSNSSSCSVPCRTPTTHQVMWSWIRVLWPGRQTRPRLENVRLRILAAIAAHGSVTKAAHHLNYSQPAVSHHLARLEAETGARLVQRIGRGIRLTPEGQHLAHRATEIVGRVDTAAAELA